MPFTKRTGSVTFQQQTIFLFLCLFFFFSDYINFVYHIYLAFLSNHVMSMNLKKKFFFLIFIFQGLCKAVLSASSKSAVKSICFLDPCLFPLDTPHYPPYPTSAATFLLAECADGSQALFDTCDGSQQIPRCVAEK